MKTLPKIKKKSGFGRCLFAEKAYKAGELILEEEPLIVVDYSIPLQNLQLPSINVPKSKKKNFEVLYKYMQKIDAFLGSSKSVQKMILDCCYPNLSSDHPVVCRARQLASVIIRQACCAAYTVDLLQRVSLIFDLNSRKYSAGNKVCIYRLGSKMNHSCVANTATNGLGNVWALRDITEGEELTTNYLGDSMAPTYYRQRKLLASKLFICGCSLCSTQYSGEAEHYCKMPCPSCKPLGKRKKGLLSTSRNKLQEKSTGYITPLIQKNNAVLWLCNNKNCDFSLRVNCPEKGMIWQFPTLSPPISIEENTVVTDLDWKCKTNCAQFYVPELFFNKEQKKRIEKTIAGISINGIEVEMIAQLEELESCSGEEASIVQSQDIFLKAFKIFGSKHWIVMKARKHLVNIHLNAKVVQNRGLGNVKEKKTLRLDEIASHLEVLRNDAEENQEVASSLYKVSCEIISKLFNRRGDYALASYWYVRSLPPGRIFG
eukprot:g3671.t1